MLALIRGTTRNTSGLGNSILLSYLCHWLNPPSTSKHVKQIADRWSAGKEHVRHCPYLLIPFESIESTWTYVTPCKLLLAILSNLYPYLLPQADRASAAGLLPPKRTHRRCRRPALCLAPQGGGDCAGASTADLSTSMPGGLGKNGGNRWESLSLDMGSQQVCNTSVCWFEQCSQIISWFLLLGVSPDLKTSTNEGGWGRRHWGSRPKKTWDFTKVTRVCTVRVHPQTWEQTH